MRNKILKPFSAVMAVILMFCALPFCTASAEDGELTVSAVSNFFNEGSVTISDWNRYEDYYHNAYVSVEFSLYAPGKHLVGVQINSLSWDPAVLELKQSYNKLDGAVNIFPFAVSQGWGSGVVNFNNASNGKLYANFSGVGSEDEMAALAYDGDLPVTVVRAVFKVLDRNAGSTTVSCTVGAVSMCEVGSTSPLPTIFPVKGETVNSADAACCTLPAARVGGVPKPYVSGHTLTVSSGVIGVNFYLSIKNIEDIKDCKAYFVWGSADRTPGLNYDEDTLVYTTAFGSFYKATCTVPAPAMTEKITLKLYDSNGVQLLSSKYSVADYTSDAQRTAQNNVYFRNMVCDMLDYGGAAQTYFGMHTDDMASDYIGTVDPGNTWSRNEVQSLTDTTKMSGLTNDYGLQYAGMSMIVRAKVIIKLFFTVTDADKFSRTSVYCGETLLTPEKQNNHYIISVTDIKADKIFDDIPLTFKNTDGETEISKERVANAAGYYNSALAGSNTNLKALMNAMHNYSQSTADYIRNRSNQGS